MLSYKLIKLSLWKIFLIKNFSLFSRRNVNFFNYFLSKQHNTREERDLRSINTETPRGNNRVSAGASSQVNGTSSSSGSGDEEWRNIHTMLSCISGMVDKTKRAISILQHRGTDSVSSSHHHESTVISDIRRQTEEKIAEFRRNAEDAVNQVRQQQLFRLCLNGI